jgi:excisionase family DNA binding protein
MCELSCAEVATRIGLSRETVYQLVRQGVLPHTRAGHNIRIREADLGAYLAAARSRAWAPVDRRGRPAATAEGRALRAQLLACTKSHRWTVRAPRELLAVGEAETWDEAIDALAVALRAFTRRYPRRRLAGLLSAPVDERRMTFELPLAYVELQRFLASEAGQRMRRDVEAVLQAADARD